MSSTPTVHVDEMYIHSTREYSSKLRVERAKTWQKRGSSTVNSIWVRSGSRNNAVSFGIERVT